MSLFGSLMRRFEEWNARGKSYDEILQRLAKNEASTLQRMQNATDSTSNRQRACHVIGIERWAAHRLGVLLGEPLVMDEYDGYAPSSDLTMAELAVEFQRTRAATNARVAELQSKGVDVTATVKHNELGDLSAGGWLSYIASHTGRETMILSQQK